MDPIAPYPNTMTIVDVTLNGQNLFIRGKAPDEQEACYVLDWATAQTMGRDGVIAWVQQQGEAWDAAIPTWVSSLITEVITF